MSRLENVYNMYQVYPNLAMRDLHPREREQKAMFRAYLFGPFRLLSNNMHLGEPVWRRNKAKSLLKWFLLHPGKLYSADQLIELFWPSVSTETGYRNLHVIIHYLRHLLEPTLKRGQQSRYIPRTSNGFYQFILDENWWVDTLEVYTALEMAREHDRKKEQTRAVAYYRSIVSYCEKGFLPEDIYEPSFDSHRREYECLYVNVLLRLIEIHSQRDEFDEALEYAYQALRQDPYCEPAIKTIVSIYLEQGNSSGALHKLDEFEHFLQTELGAKPSREIWTLKEKIHSWSV